MSSHNRRAFLAGAAAATGAATLAASGLAFGRAYAKPAAKPASLSGFVDVHHHLFPPAMVTALKSRLPEFSLPGVQRSIVELNAGGTDTALISFPNSDIVSFELPRLANLVRSSNLFATGLARQYPGRYGLFASLPMPHIEASLKELEHAFEQLHAAGILLISNYNNKWLGDAQFAPVLEELNRRKVLVFVHPNAADCCRGLIPGLSDSVIEYETDTARTIASLLFSGAAERYRDIRFIFSHAGGTLPALIERFTSATRVSPEVAGNVPQGVMTYLKSFYYDTAQAAAPTALGALLNFIPPQQVLFGTDFPYRGTQEQVTALQAIGLKPPALKGILSGNARRLLGAQ